MFELINWCQVQAIGCHNEVMRKEKKHKQLKMSESALL